MDRKLSSSVTNTHLIGVAVPVDFGWVAYANSGYQEVVSVAYNSVKINLLVLLVGTLLSLFLAYTISRRVMKPIYNLQQFARQVPGGNLDMRASINGTDELAATGEALNEMASHIKQLEAGRRLFIQSSAHDCMGYKRGQERHRVVTLCF